MVDYEREAKRAIALRYAFGISSLVIAGFFGYMISDQMHIDDHSPASLQVDIDRQQQVIDNQYDLVLENIYDESRYIELRKQVSICIDLVHDYNRSKPQTDPELPVAKCDRLFP